jgi:FkbM family methyltransferase
MNSFNPFVLQQVSTADIRSPNIPSNLPEQYAQCGEDLTILALVRALRRARLIPDWNDQVTIEIGANHAFGGSNTYLLETRLGIHSVLVEANPDLLADLRKARPDARLVHAAICTDDSPSVTLHCANHHELSSLDRQFVETWHAGQVGVSRDVQVPAMRMASLLANHVPANKQVLFLSIDIEGLDLTLIEDTDFSRFRPTIVMLEPSEHFHPGEGARMIQAMLARGYCQFGESDVNLLFVDAAILARLTAPALANLEAAAAPEGNKHDPADSAEPSVSALSADIQNLALDAAAPNPLGEWQLDTGFLDEVLAAVESRGVLTLDVFDNAITRRLASPIDVFAEVERQLRAQHGATVEGFAAAREHAETIARQRQHQLNGAEEITFRQIYLELPPLLPAFTDWDQAAATELQVERDSLVAVPDILELTRRTRAAGRPYAFVSDMYLPADFLGGLLHDLGYDGWDKLYVSSALGATKATGHIWQVIAKDFPLRNIVHVGDNAHSDVAMPRTHGIATFAYRRAVSEPRLGTHPNADMVSYSLWQRHVELQSAANPMPRSEQRRWHDLGRGFGATLLSAFVQWLGQRVQTHRIDRLYFCARDGHLMQRAWEASGLARALPVDHRYLCISRASLNLANAARECTPDHLNPATLSFLSSSLGKTPLSTALQRAGLDRIDALTCDLQSAFGSLDAMLDGMETAQRFESILQTHSVAIHAVLTEKYAACIQYLRQEGLADDGRYAIVDMGWHGSLQRSMAGLCSTAFPGFQPLLGFYYGLWPAVARNRYLAGPMEACFSSSFLSEQAQSQLHQGVALLEELHSAAHGTTLDYRLDADGRVSPVFQTTNRAQAGNDQRTGWFQQGVVDGVQELFSGDARPVDAAVIGIPAAQAALGALFLSPSADELQLLSQIGHCATFDHSTLDLIIQHTVPDSIEHMRHQLCHAEWAAGQLRQWWLSGDTRVRGWIHTLAAEMYPGFGTRALRQFN